MKRRTSCVSLWLTRLSEKLPAPPAGHWGGLITTGMLSASCLAMMASTALASPDFPPPGLKEWEVYSRSSDHCITSRNLTSYGIRGSVIKQSSGEYEPLIPALEANASDAELEQVIESLLVYPSTGRQCEGQDEIRNEQTVDLISIAQDAIDSGWGDEFYLAVWNAKMEQGVTTLLKAILDHEISPELRAELELELDSRDYANLFLPGDEYDLATNAFVDGAFVALALGSRTVGARAAASSSDGFVSKCRKRCRGLPRKVGRAACLAYCRLKMLYNGEQAPPPPPPPPPPREVIPGPGPGPAPGPGGNPQ